MITHNNDIHEIRLGKKYIYFSSVFVFLSVLAIRLLIINIYGVNIPFVDEWWTELDSIILFKENSLTLKYLFGPHVNHIVFFPKLWWILLYCVRGYWDILFELKCQALIPALSAFLINFWLLKDINRRSFFSTVLVVLIFAYPFSIENLLSGFQICMHLCFFFTILSLRIIASEKINFIKVFISATFAFFAFLSLAGGVFTTLIISFYCLYRYLKEKKIFILYYSLVLFLFFILFFIITPRVGNFLHTNFVLVFFLKLACLKYLWILLVSIPFLIFIIIYILRARLPDKKYDFPFLLYVFGYLTFFSAVYTRGSAGDRHMDLLLSFAVGCLIIIDLFYKDYFFKKIRFLPLNFFKIIIIILFFLSIPDSIVRLETREDYNDNARNGLFQALYIFENGNRIGAENFYKNYGFKINPFINIFNKIINSDKILHLMKDFNYKNYIQINYGESVKLEDFFDNIKIEKGMLLSASSGVGYVQGWACIPNMESSDNKIFILFRNKTEVFKVRPFYTKRRDVSRYLETKGKYDNSGFYLNFSNIDLPKGVYQIGILVQNEKKSIYEWKSEFFFNDTTEKVKPEIIDLACLKNEIESKINYNIDRIDKKIIRGWALIENHDANKSVIFILFKKESNDRIFRIRATSQIRKDVSAFYHKRYFYDHSGFYIPLNSYDFSPGIYVIGFQIINDGKVLYRWTDSTIKVN